MVIDIDGLFEGYFRKFIAENMGKYTEEQLENKVAEIYLEFGDASLKELSGKSPKQYFSEMSAKELVQILCECVKEDIPVSDFLCDEIEKRSDAEDELVKLVGSETDDELATYALNLLASQNSVKALSKYVVLIKEGTVGVSLLESMTEALCENADEVKELVLENYISTDDSAKYFVEILSCMSQDDRIYEILRSEFVAHKESISLYLSYLTKYGDDRILATSYEVIKREEITYVDYKELQLAIEFFGGEFEDNRNFAKDKNYAKIKGN